MLKPEVWLVNKEPFKQPQTWIQSPKLPVAIDGRQTQRMMISKSATAGDAPSCKSSIDMSTRALDHVKHEAVVSSLNCCAALLYQRSHTRPKMTVSDATKFCGYRRRFSTQNRAQVKAKNRSTEHFPFPRQVPSAKTMLRIGFCVFRRRGGFNDSPEFREAISALSSRSPATRTVTT